MDPILYASKIAIFFIIKFNKWFQKIRFAFVEKRQRSKISRHISSSDMIPLISKVFLIHDLLLDWRAKIVDTRHFFWLMLRSRRYWNIVAHLCLSLSLLHTHTLYLYLPLSFSLSLTLSVCVGFYLSTHVSSCFSLSLSHSLSLWSKVFKYIVYVCVSKYVCVSMSVCAEFVCEWIWLFVHLCECACACVCVFLCEWVCVCVCVCMWVFVRVRVSVCVWGPHFHSLLYKSINNIGLLLEISFE